MELILLSLGLVVLLTIQHDVSKMRREATARGNRADERAKAAAIARGPRPTEQRGQAREVGGW